MEDRINQALAQLENDLHEIISARNQVESTIKASAELQTIVGNYVSSVKELCASLQSWEVDLKAHGEFLSREYEKAISQLNLTCTENSRAFETIVEKTGSNFKSDAEHEIVKFKEQNEKLADRIIEMNTFRDEIKRTASLIQSIKESLAQISKDLKESQAGQDEALDKIKQKLSNVVDAVHDSTHFFDNKAGQLNQVIIESKSEISTNIDTLISKVDLISSNIDNLNTLCYNIKSDIMASLANISNEIKDEIKGLKDEITKVTIINRCILIVAFIILVILHFVI